MGMAFGEAAGRSGRWGSRGSPACSCHLPRRGGVSGIPEAAVTTSGGSTRWLQRTLASPFRGWSSWRRRAFSRHRAFAPGFDLPSVSLLVAECLRSTTAAGPATPGSLNPADDFRAPPVSNDASMRGHGSPGSRSGCRWYGSCPHSREAPGKHQVVVSWSFSTASSCTCGVLCRRDGTGTEF